MVGCPLWRLEFVPLLGKGKRRKESGGGKKRAAAAVTGESLQGLPYGLDEPPGAKNQGAAGLRNWLKVYGRDSERPAQSLDRTGLLRDGRPR